MNLTVTTDATHVHVWRYTPTRLVRIFTVSRRVLSLRQVIETARESGHKVAVYTPAKS